MGGLPATFSCVFFSDACCVMFKHAHVSCVFTTYHHAMVVYAFPLLQQLVPPLPASLPTLLLPYLPASYPTTHHTHLPPHHHHPSPCPYLLCPVMVWWWETYLPLPPSHLLPSYPHLYHHHHLPFFFFFFTISLLPHAQVW